VKTQVWIAMSVYVLIAILRKRMVLEHLSLWQISQVLSLTCFEKRGGFTPHDGALSVAARLRDGLGGGHINPPISCS
jgi:hypothetical protein